MVIRSFEFWRRMIYFWGRSQYKLTNLDGQCLVERKGGRKTGSTGEKEKESNTVGVCRGNIRLHSSPSAGLWGEAVLKGDGCKGQRVSWNLRNKGRERDVAFRQSWRMLHLPPIKWCSQEAVGMQSEITHRVCKYLDSLCLPTAHDGLHNNLVQSHTKYYKVCTPNTFIFPAN